MTARDVQLLPAEAERLCVDLLVAHGASADNAEIVAEHLVTSSLVGLHSHGFMRVPQYVAEIRAGLVDPAAVPRVIPRDRTRAEVDGRRTFGQVAATAGVRAAADLVVDSGIALVAVRRAGHAGRIGAFTEALARAGHVSLAFASGSLEGHRVAPFGGRAGRMATNPISWAAPTSSEPLVADLATSAITEGFVRSARKRGLPVPAGTLCEPDGQPTIEAAALYGDPPGFLLPLGGERFGHKGYALSLLVEIIATTLAGDTPDDPGRWGNNLALVALRADEKFVKRADALCSYLRSAPPGDPASKVLLPGEPERLAAERNRHVAVDAATWAEIEALAASAGVDLPPAPSGIQPPSTGSVAPEM